MPLDTNANRLLVISLFPELSEDSEFKITSNQDTNYNCIAWANGRDNIWWWPFPKLDGVCEWPIPETDPGINTLVKLFESKGYSICTDSSFNPQYVKVALYADSNGDFTHAARQDRKGLWKTKLGESFDIVHGTPFTIEGELYGEVKIFMAAKF